MVRWKNIKARLILLVLCATFLLLAMDPLIHWAIVKSSQALTGTNVTIDSMDTSWFGRTILLRGFRATDPLAPQRSIFAADFIKLQIDGGALAHRQVRIPRAQVSGLWVDADRRSPGILEAEDGNSYGQALAERFVSEGGLWLEVVGQHLNAQLDRRLESSDLVAQLLDRWPAEYHDLEAQVTEINDRIAELQSTLVNVDRNPLRDTLADGQTTAELELLSQELAALRTSANRLQQQMLMDRDSVETAQAGEFDSTTDRLAVETLDADHLSEYLLGPETAERVAALTQWIRWSRRFLPSLHGPAAELHGRGVNLVLPGFKPQPDILIDTLVLSGEALVGDRPLQIEGTMKGLSSHFELSERPAEVVVQTTGEMQLLIQAELSGTGQQIHDRVVVNCPNWSLDERTLGDTNQLAFTVAPAEAHVWVSIQVDGDVLSGEMVMKQAVVRPQPIMGSWLQATPVSAVVADAVAKIDSIESEVVISGTLDNPKWKLRSNIGYQLSQNLQRGLDAHCLAQHDDRLRSRQSGVERQLADSMATLAQRHTHLLAVIDQGQGALESATALVATRFDRTNASSPLRDTIRR